MSAPVIPPALRHAAEEIEALAPSAAPRALLAAALALSELGIVAERHRETGAADGAVRAARACRALARAAEAPDAATPIPALPPGAA